MCLVALWTARLTAKPQITEPSYGAHLQIDLNKQNSTELARTSLTEPAIAAFFGSVLAAPKEGLTGELVPFYPIDGCSNLKHDPLFHQLAYDGLVEYTSRSNSTKFVVLMRKGRCSYSDMFQSANRIRNVVGILVFDPKSSMGGSLSITGKDDFVPTFLISPTLGEELLKKVVKYRERGNLSAVDQNEAPMIRVTMAWIPVKINLSKWLQVLLVIVMVALILALILSLFWNYHSRRVVSEESPQPPPMRRPEDIPIDDEFIAKLPKRSFRSPNTSPVDFAVQSPDGQMLLESEDDYRQRVPHNDTCPICVDEFRYGIEIHQLWCGHCYHPACIVPWLKHRSPMCPLCMIDVRVSLIESEELAFVRSLRRQQYTKRTSIDMSAGKTAEMKEIYVMSSAGSLRDRNASFDSIPLEAAPAPRPRDRPHRVLSAS